MRRILVPLTSACFTLTLSGVAMAPAQAAVTGHEFTHRDKAFRASPCATTGNVCPVATPGRHAPPSPVTRHPVGPLP
jgi:hypothetical protein